MELCLSFVWCPLYFLFVKRSESKTASQANKKKRKNPFRIVNGVQLCKLGCADADRGCQGTRVSCVLRSAGAQPLQSATLFFWVPGCLGASPVRDGVISGTARSASECIRTNSAGAKARKQKHTMGRSLQSSARVSCGWSKEKGLQKRLVLEDKWPARAWADSMTCGWVCNSHNKWHSVGL